MQGQGLCHELTNAVLPVSFWAGGGGHNDSTPGGNPSAAAHKGFESHRLH